MRISPLSYELLLSLPGRFLASGEKRTASSSLLDSVTLGTKIVFDRAACALRSALSINPRSLDWLRIAREVEEADSVWDEHGWAVHPDWYHHVPPPPVAVTVDKAQSRGTKFLHVRFASEYEPHIDEPGRRRWLVYAPNRTAHAWVLRHPGSPRPWLMCIHGYGLGLPFLDFDAFRATWMHEKLGLNVVFPVLPLHGPRRIGWQSGEGFLSGDVLDTVHAEAQAIWDARRVLAWIRAQESDVVGVYGLSLGGYNAALLAAVDPRLACVIAGIPASDFVQLARLHSPMSVKYASQAGVNWEQVGRVFRAISPLSLEPLVAHERRYIFGGSADCIVPPEQVSALWQFWGKPRIQWYAGSHLSCPWEPAVSAFLHGALRATFGESPRDVSRWAA